MNTHWETKIKRLSLKRKLYLDKKCRQLHRWRKPANKATVRDRRTFEQRKPGVWQSPIEFDLSKGQNRKTLLLRLSQLRQLAVSAETLCLDFSRTEKLSADATLLFFAELRRLIKHSKMSLKISCIPPVNDKVSQVFQQIGLFDLLGAASGATPQDEDVVNWRFAHGHKVDGARYEDVLANFDGDIANALQQSLFTGITEAMTNVVNHAYDRPREDGTGIANSKEWWMFSQAKDGLLTVAFLDLGAGIPRTLPENRPTLWKKFLRIGKRLDSRAIDYAVKDSISRTNESHRGKGLGQILRVVDSVPGGEMAILSNFGALIRKNAVTRRIDYRDSILGTLIYWNIPLESEDGK